MKTILILMTALLMLTSCSPEEDNKSVDPNGGYTKVEIYDKLSNVSGDVTRIKLLDDGSIQMIYRANYKLAGLINVERAKISYTVTPGHPNTAFSVQLVNAEGVQSEMIDATTTTTVYTTHDSDLLQLGTMSYAQVYYIRIKSSEPMDFRINVSASVSNVYKNRIGDDYIDVSSTPVSSCLSEPNMTWIN